MAILSEQAVSAALETLAWERDGDLLVKEVALADFAGAMGFVNAVADLANQRDHHPDIDIRWNRVTLRLTTHSQGGITEADLELARAIDALPRP
jgi:4a-hydroxytetrahydrobiopterin dehydratase